MATTSESPPTSPGRAFLLYNAGRLGLLLLFGGILWLAGFRGLVLLLFALLFSGAASWFLLGRQRVAVSQALAAQVRQRRDRMAARTAAEDAAADLLARRSGGSDDAA